MAALIPVCGVGVYPHGRLLGCDRLSPVGSATHRRGNPGGFFSKNKSGDILSVRGHELKGLGWLGWG